MYKTKIISLTLLCVFLAATLTVSAASAITGNYQPDDIHKYVGIAVFYDDTNNAGIVQVSTAVLISPRVALTAAHSCISDRVVVSFDSGPLTWRISETGEVQVDGVTSIHWGTAYPNPEFAVNVAGKNGLPSTDYRDIAVIVFDQDVPTNEVNTYAQLPKESLVDTLKVNTPVTLVGYGVQEHLTPRKAGIENTWTGSIARMNATAKILSTNFVWSDEFLRCSANPGQGRGGIAYGDSGGPVFLRQTSTVLAVNSYVTNPNCAGQTYHSRIDIPEVIEWINQWMPGGVYA